MLIDTGAASLLSAIRARALAIDEIGKAASAIGLLSKMTGSI